MTLFQPVFTLFPSAKGAVLQFLSNVPDFNTTAVFPSIKGVDGWLSKEAKEEKNIGVEEFSKDLIEDGIEQRTSQFKHG